MRLAVSDRIAAPPEAVYARISDFDALAEELRGPALSLQRIASPAGEDRFRAAFELKGIRQRTDIRLFAQRPPAGYDASGETGGVRADLQVRLLADGQATRAALTCDLRATSFKGRLLLHSMTLIQGTLSARLSDRFARYARKLEDEIGGA